MIPCSSTIRDCSIAVLGTIVAAVVPTGASAGAQPTQAALTAENSRSIAAGAPTLAPFAYLKFCQRAPQDCAGDGRAAWVELTPERLSELRAVNEVVNRRIAPSAGISSEEAWSLTARRGNCNTFALQKRHDLLARGWPVGSLLLAVVTTPAGTGHLVLVIRSARGDVVLDNLRAEIRDWTRTGYRWHKIQAPGQPDNWVEVSPLIRGVANLAD